MFQRTIEQSIEQYLFRGRVITLFGARRTGKTTLVKALLAKHADKRTRYLNCDMLSVQQALGVQDAEPLKAYLGDYDLVVLDEAQNIAGVGKVLKILVDTYPEMQIIATGSSAFDLASRTGEPLTGRVFPFKLYPLSLQEIAGNDGYSVIQPQLERFLRFGLYPSIVNLNDQDAAIYLDELVGNYLYKDVLAFAGVRRAGTIIDLVRLLALRVGNEVSYHELATMLGVDRKTVMSYIDLLEQCFVVFRLGAFSRNLRKEIAKSQKIYFYDVGARNAILNTFAPPAQRPDIGAIWENFCIVERLKVAENNRLRTNRYFWRTYDQQEIDFVEERDGVLTGYEFKWNPERRARVPGVFLESYAGSKIEKVDPGNYWRYLL